jgi:hypothetical protein
VEGGIAVPSWKELPGPARAIGTAIGRAVDAAGRRDRHAYEVVVADVASLPAEPTGRVLGALVQLLLEEQHPDGLDGDDVRVVLGHCYREAARWLPIERIDMHTLVAVVMSALGIHEPGVTYLDAGLPTAGTSHGEDGANDPADAYAHGASSIPTVPSLVPTSEAYAWHAPLLVAALLATRQDTVFTYLDAVFAQIAASETAELP